MVDDYCFAGIGSVSFMIAVRRIMDADYCSENVIKIIEAADDDINVKRKVTLLIVK